MKITAWIGAVFLLMGTVVQAAPDTAPEASSSKLQNIRQAIDATQKDLAVKQEAHRKAQQTLAQAKAALAAAQRELTAMNRRREVAWQRLQKLQGDLSKLQAEIANSKAQIARLLVANYRNRQPHAVVLFLKNADSNQKSRFLTYTRLINQSNDQVIQKLAVQEKELAVQEKAVNDQVAKLQALVNEQQQKMQQLGQTRSQAQATSQKLNQEMASSRSRLAQLREDEQRLNSVVAGIMSRQSAQRRAEAEARTQAARQRVEQAAKAQNELSEAELAAAPPVIKPEPKPEPKPVESNVGNRQGNLPMPTSGRVAGSYGSTRATGGTWNGLFIETASSGVQSVAAGTVAYAANLRGFGNTVIIDHGDGYMSTYAGLSQIAVSNGSRVGARKNIGTSGTLPAGEQGLYFELRYRGRAINPRSWVR
ncbi:murein hydrolase activator EnvC family protein [Kingella kingae]|uniref:murein hydrolase activator EnvC family protein n=1 Tax=Kingella kingae TaxID=504 RepID=UPI00041A92C1|nr:peptidoglycan DD-metalloendopeptidase family protein [Kingella kingae]